MKHPYGLQKRDEFWESFDKAMEVLDELENSPDILFVIADEAYDAMFNRLKTAIRLDAESRKAV